MQRGLFLSCLLFQRISTLCRVLGKQDEYFKKVVQGMTSSESIDLQALMQAGLPKPALDHNNHDQHRRESDSESGFEDYSSQMSKSINDDAYNNMSHSTSMDNLMIDQLVLELKSVAVDWKTFRNVKQCSCAVPFEHHTRRVSRENVPIFVLVYSLI